MNKLNFLLFILLMEYATFSFSVFYVMKISYNNKENNPLVLGYYKGQKMKFDQDMCFFKDKDKTATFILVVTDQVTTRTSLHNITYLERIPNKPCKIYYFSQQGNKWEVEEENIEDMPNRLADSAFVLLLNPEYIEKIDSTLVTSSDNCIYLPKIHIKNLHGLSNELDIIALNSLDTNAVHSPVSTIKIANNISLISLQENV